MRYNIPGNVEQLLLSGPHIAPSSLQHRLVVHLVFIALVEGSQFLSPVCRLTGTTDVFLHFLHFAHVFLQLVFFPRITELNGKIANRLDEQQYFILKSVPTDEISMHGGVR